MIERSLLTNTIAAEAYEKYLVPGIFRPWAEVAVAVAAPRPGINLLDVACGTGIGARIAARRMILSGSITGLDADPGMIAVARSIALEMDCFFNWRQGDALAMPFENRKFDLCLCLEGLQYFPNHAAGLEEMRRVLKPNGKLVVSAWSDIEFNKGHQALIQALERQNIDTAPLWQSFSLSAPHRLKELALQAGFRDAEILTEEKNVFFASTKLFFDQVAFEGPAILKTLANIPEALRADIFSDFEIRLKSYVVNGQLSFPMRTSMLIARA